MVVGSLSLTNMRTPVIPITPPVAAMARMASSVLVRGCPPDSTRLFECVKRTGRDETSQASSVVRSPECETSTAIPISFMRSTIATPKSEMPPSTRSVAPLPIMLREL